MGTGILIHGIVRIAVILLDSMDTGYINDEANTPLFYRIRQQ